MEPARRNARNEAAAFGWEDRDQDLSKARPGDASVVDLKFLRFAWHLRLGTSNPKTTLESINC